MLKRGGEPVIQVLSVVDILRHLRADDGWKLSVAQRAFEWDANRVTKLVDSLLRGFPVGTLLLHRTRRPYYNAGTESQLRPLLQSAGPTVQLVDGQQRCHALLASFGGDGLNDRKGRGKLSLWVNVSAYNGANREFDPDLGQRYWFHWSFSVAGPNGLSAPERRKEGLPARAPACGWLDFHDACDAVRENGGAAELLHRAGLRTTDATAETVAHSLARDLRCAMEDERVPVQTINAKDTDVYDIHQLFIRINTGGMPLGQADVFFAGVKKYWVEAEERLMKLVAGESLFERASAISLLARCAGGSLPEKDRFDPVRLHLSDLVRARRGDRLPLVERMSELVPAGGESSLVRSVEIVSLQVRRRFYEARRSLRTASLAAVVAWTMQMLEHRSVDPVEPGPLPEEAARFLFWTAVFRSHAYGRSAFDRESFRLAWNAGAAGQPFPYNGASFQDLCFGYDRVRRNVPAQPRPGSLCDRADPAQKAILQLTRDSKPMMLGIVQSLDHQAVDWDHIVAYEWARSRFKKGHAVLWNYFEWVNELGNFAAIDSSANRALQARPPSQKLARGKRQDEQHYGNIDFIHTNPNILADEERSFLEVEKLLEAQQVDKAGETLRQVVAARTYRIWLAMLDRFGAPPLPRAVPVGR